MSDVLVLQAGTLFPWTPSLQCADGALSDAQVLQRFYSNPVTIVLKDPCFLSACVSIELKSRRERGLLAHARCVELAGAGGFARWCVIPHQSTHRLFILALDPNSADSSRLSTLCAAGLVIKTLSSQSVLHYSQSLPNDSGFRVLVDENSVQISLLLYGQWVFARRVDLQDATVSEAIGSTLGYLQSQAYIELPLRGRWQLQTEHAERLHMSELYQRGKPLLDLPQVLPLTGQTFSAIEPAVSLEWTGTEVGGFQRQSEALVGVTRAVSLLLLCIVLPFLLLADVEPPVVVVPAVPDIPENIQQRNWVMGELQALGHQDINETVALLALILEETNRFEGVDVQGFSVANDQEVRLSCVLGENVEDPLLRQRYFNQLQRAIADKVSAKTPIMQVRIFASDQYSVGESKTGLGFEIVVGGDDADQ